MNEIQTHWTEAQKLRLNECIENGDVIAFWCSDKQGTPCNGGSSEVQASPGLINCLPSTTTELCSDKALHGTTKPNAFLGERVWVCAFRRDVKHEASAKGKLGSLEREYIGEVLPTEAMDSSVMLRLGVKNLAGASLMLSHAKMMDLSSVNFAHADLSGSRFIKCLMRHADFRGANLTNVDFTDSYIFGAKFDSGALEKLGFEMDKDGYAIKSPNIFQRIRFAFDNTLAWLFDLNLKPI